MRVSDRIRLQHIVDTGESIARFISGRQRKDLDSDKMLLFAVVRALEMIGGAASRAEDETRMHTRGIPWADIVGMRNRIVPYWDVNRNIVWKAAAEEVPALLVALRAALAADAGD
jgi:uncharacterized protein with HEPN domain